MTRHPVPARLKAFALYKIDFNGEVAQHIRECDGCAQLVAEELRVGEPVSRGQARTGR